MTATSGPGLSLYSENIGLAIMAEVPLVIVDVQRLGPSTGGATTVGQGDVQMARWGTAGGYPIIVLAPSCVADCFTLTIRAFNLAVRFQCPVILLSDKEINLTTATVELEPSPILPKPEPAVSVSPPFGEGVVRHRTGSTHDEFGRIVKDPEKIQEMNDRLLNKINDNQREIEHVQLDEEKDADTLFISYGVTACAMSSAVALCREMGKRVSSAKLQSVWPVPAAKLRKAAEKVRRIIIAELNPGLYTREIQRLFPSKQVESLQRIDGSMIKPTDFVEAIS
jgi:2-oxoglutarate ferredoxin oxidoreductase subunit alpha